MAGRRQRSRGSRDGLRRQSVRFLRVGGLDDHQPVDLDDGTITYVRDHDRLFLFGDSTGVQDGKALATELMRRAAISLAVHNWSGRPTRPAVDALENWADHVRPAAADPDGHTGTNEIFDPPMFAAQADRTMKIVGPNRNVIWVNTQISRTAKSATIQVADQRNSAGIDSQIHDADKKYPNLRVVR